MIADSRGLMPRVFNKFGIFGYYGMETNAKFVWHLCNDPWMREEELISCIDLPINLDQNKRDGFHNRPERTQTRCKVAHKTVSDPATIGQRWGLSIFGSPSPRRSPLLLAHPCFPRRADGKTLSRRSSFKT